MQNLPDADKTKIEAPREDIYQAKRAIQSRIPAEVGNPVPPTAASTEDLHADLFSLRQSLNEVIEITKLPEDNRRRFELVRENVQNALHRLHIEEVRQGVVEGGMDPGEIPAYLAVTAELVPPDLYSITKSVDEAMKRVINSSPDLKEKLAATKDKHYYAFRCCLIEGLGYFAASRAASRRALV